MGFGNCPLSELMWAISFPSFSKFLRRASVMPWLSARAARWKKNGIHKLGFGKKYTCDIALCTVLGEKWKRAPAQISGLIMI